MAYNPNKHHRRSIRLKGYDYSQAGMYFITICVQNRHCLFGEIVGADLRVCPNGNNEIIGKPLPEHNSDKQKMILNDAGKMIKKWFWELESKFPDIKCGEFVVMPNHFHCVIINTGNDSKKYDLGISDFGKQISGEHIGSPQINTGEHIGSPQHNSGEHIGSPQQISGEHIGSPLRTIIQWFKTMTTNEYIRGVKTLGWEPFNGKLWERNYWERIIRDEKSFENITKYIINNPKNWNSDKLK